jgi:hypothetical protein
MFALEGRADMDDSVGECLPLTDAVEKGLAISGEQ